MGLEPKTSYSIGRGERILRDDSNDRSSVYILQSSLLRPSYIAFRKKTGNNCCTNMLNKPYLLSRFLEPQKKTSEEMFPGPSTDPHKVFGRLGIKVKNNILYTTRWGPLTTISGFIPSYTHLQPWLNRVCWGYNFPLFLGGPLLVEIECLMFISISEVVTKQ